MGSSYRFACLCSLAFAAVVSSTAIAGDDLESEMRPIDVNGYSLVDAQYLPFTGTAPLRYPEDVLWGFYADDATYAAKTCAHRGFLQIKSFFSTNQSELRRMAALGGARDFFLWVSDYTEADASRSRRQARLWHWGVPSGDYASGNWNWEAVVTQQGTCVLPSADNVKQALLEAIARLSR